MCINNDVFQSVSREKLTKRQKNLCNELLDINRDVICSILKTYIQSHEKPVKCLEGLGVCGTNGIIWKHYFDEDVDVTINGIFEEDFDLINNNVELNKVKLKVNKDDPCILLRQNHYDFIYLNCKTNAALYFDSVFSHIQDNSVLIISTSEDPSLYWQAPQVALRNYSGVIAKTSCHREVSIRLVIAEMARSAAKYHKGITVYCAVAYKPQQSFTIVVKCTKGISEANSCFENIKKLAYCNICEERSFIQNSVFLDKQSYFLNCDCVEKSEGKITVGIGPLWAGEIFDVEFLEKVIVCENGSPWSNTAMSLFKLILEEARCDGLPRKDDPPKKKIKNSFDNKPYFYINTHRHSAKKFQLKKVSEIINLLHKNGFRASRTHFDSEAVRTNASVTECKKILSDVT